MSMATCIYCGHNVKYGPGTNFTQGQAYRLLVLHDWACPENPNVKERKVLETCVQNLAETLHRLATYPDDCNEAERQHAQRLAGRFLAPQIANMLPGDTPESVSDT